MHTRLPSAHPGAAAAAAAWGGAAHAALSGCASEARLL